MKAIYFYLFLFISTISPCVSQTLDDYLKEAAENNPNLKASHAEFEVALQQISQMRALPDPNLSVSAFGRMIETRVGQQQARISLTQMFPWFGTLKASGNVASLNADAKYQLFLDDQNELYFQVKSAYYPLYELEAQLRLQKKNLAILTTYKELATIAFSNGKSALVDALRVDIMMDELKTDIQLLKDKKKPLEVAFNRLLSRNDSLSVVIEDSLELSEKPISTTQDSLFAANPTLQALDLQIQAAHINESLAEKQGRPQFGVGIDYVVIAKRPDVSIPQNGQDAIMPMVSMSLPIYRGKYKALRKEATLMETALTSQKIVIENRLTSQYEMAWYELEKSRQMSELYATQSKKTQQVVELLYVSYSNSGKDFEEILRMQQQLLAYETAGVTAVKNFYIALAQIDYLTAKGE